VHRLKFIQREQQAENIFAHTFAVSEPVEWTAGQSIRLEVDGIYGPEERRFTISSAPFQKVITIVTRMSDSIFKQALARLHVGDEVRGYDIKGNFVWPDHKGPLLFLASGMGITPYYSMLQQRIHAQLAPQVTLVHAARKGELLFAKQFREWAHHQPSFRYVALEGERLTAATVATQFPEFLQGSIFLSGPGAMVREVATELREAYHLAEGQLHQDQFTGRLLRDD